MNVEAGKLIAGLTFFTIAVAAFNYQSTDNNDTNLMLEKFETLSNKIETNSDFLTKQISDVKSHFQDRASYLESTINELQNKSPVVAEKHLTNDLIQAREQLSVLEASIKSVEQSIKQTPIPQDARNNDLPEAELSDLEEDHQQKQMNYFDETLQAEDRDPDWSLAMEDSIKGKLSAENSTLEVDDVQCGSSMCRLEVSANSNEGQDVFRSFETHLEWDGQMYVTINAETNQTIAYLARDGVELKRVE